MVEIVLISLAFVSGIVAFFGPCGVAMLPAYVSYIFGLNRGKNNPLAKNLVKGFLFGIITTLGIISVYLLMGSVFSLGGAFLKPFVPWMGLIIGIILIALGVAVYFEKIPYISFPRLQSSKLATNNPSFNSFYLFGVGYGIAQLSCTLPIFLLVVFQALAVGNFIDGMLIFLIYGIGIGLGVTSVAIGTMLSKEAVQRYLAVVNRYIRKITALILIVAGLYQIYFHLVISNVLGVF